MAKATFEFGTHGTPPPAKDGRLDAPAFHRNREPIWAAISGFLDGKTGDVLEIGSGTGQHIADYARRAPKLTWWPSDMVDSHLTSISAWRAAAALGNLRSPQRIDLMEADWQWHRDEGRQGHDADRDAKLTAILCFNVIHISPWRVTENLMRGASRQLAEGGYLLTYGPYKRDGVHTAPSNEAFDASLRGRDPEWGVRDVTDVAALAQKNGLIRTDTIEMPANNLVLAFQRH